MSKQTEMMQIIPIGIQKLTDGKKLRITKDEYGHDWVLTIEEFAQYGITQDAYEKCIEGKDTEEIIQSLNNIKIINYE